MTKEQLRAFIAATNAQREEMMAADATAIRADWEADDEQEPLPLAAPVNDGSAIRGRNRPADS